jgi:hypothetical protein
MVRCAEAVAQPRTPVTSVDLDIALPQREYSSEGAEVILTYLAERGIRLGDDK